MPLEWHLNDFIWLFGDVRGGKSEFPFALH
jgi:hypothetical protein